MIKEIEVTLYGKVYKIYEPCSFDFCEEDTTNGEFDLDKWTFRTGRTDVKIYLLNEWFTNYFEKQLIQSIWQENFTISNDPYLKKENREPLTYETINDLKAKGEEVREEIKRLREVNL